MRRLARSILRSTRREKTTLERDKCKSQRALPSEGSDRGYGQRPQYAYQPLKENQIRIVEIHPGEPSDVVTISLHHEMFEADPVNGPPNIPWYEALSYAWGPQDSLERVLIAHSEIKINSHLNQALKRFRDCGGSRFMWIDALCIDQGNDAEKSKCVAKMGDIYWHAGSVVVWLGKEENNSDRAMTLLSWLGDHVDFNWETTALSFTSRGIDVTLTDRNRPLPFDASDFTSIYFLFCRDWFDRLWIRQEILLANPDTAVVTCGSHSIAWLALVRAISLIDWKFWMPSFEYRQILYQRAHYVHLITHEHRHRFAFPHLRELYRYTKCADQRDRIYAILSMDASARQIGIIPDYAGLKTHLEVYEDATRRALNHIPGLDILTECILENVLLRHADPCAPTWVPDWSTDFSYQLPFRASRWSASSCLEGPKSIIEGKRLRVVTVPIDKIVRVQPHSIRRLTKMIPTLSSIQDLVPSLQFDQEYPAGGSLLEAYTSAFTQGILFNKSAMASLKESGWNWHDALQFMRDLNTDNPEPCRWTTEHNGIITLVKMSLVGRSVFTTEAGYIGLAPESAIPGDEICVIVGCSIPLILRPVADCQRIVVGACYIEGFMNGEAVLGPLPMGLQYTTLPFGPYDFGDTEVRDPRLMRWPELDISAIPGYVETGAKYFFQVNVDDLQRHGIHNAQYYDLI